MEQELIEHEEVEELHEVRSAISSHVQELQGENDYNKIQASAEQLLLNSSRECVVNAEAMLQESRQIAHDVSREEIMLLLLENKNIYTKSLKQNLEEMKTHYENLLELDLKPNVYQEEQQYSQIEMQLNNSGTMINKLKALLQDIERKHLVMQDEKKTLQQEFEARQKMFKALVDKKTALVNEHNKRMDLLKNKTDLSQYLETLMQLEDCLKLKNEEKRVKIEAKDEIKKLDDKAALQQKELDEVNVKKKEVLLALSALNTEVERVREDKRNLLNKKLDIREAVIIGDNYKMRITTLQNEINLVKKSVHNKEKSKVDLAALRETLIKHQKENETLRTHNQGIQQKIENIYEMLQTLQKLKKDNYCNAAQKLEQEKALLVEKANLTLLESKHQITHKQCEGEVKGFEELQQSTKNCKEELNQKQQKFETDMSELTKCLDEHNMNYEKNSAYKDTVVNKTESYRNSNEQQIKLKLVEIDKIKAEIEEAKEELEKTLQLVENSVRLKDKLAKDKTSVEQEYNTKYFSIFGVNSSLGDTVRGILKSAKKVTFQGLSSDVSSSEPPSQDNNSSAASTATAEHLSLFDMIRQLPISQQIENKNKKRKYRLDSP